MTCGMERNADTVIVGRLRVRQGGDLCAGEHSVLEQGESIGRGEVVSVAGSGVIGMGMCDDGAIDGLVGVDVKIARWAIEAFVGPLENRLHDVCDYRRPKPGRPNGLFANTGKLEEQETKFGLANWV